MAAPPLALGFVPIARTTFDIALARQVTARARAALAAAGYTLSGPPALVTSAAEAAAAAVQLAAQPLDLLIVFQATFADSTLLMALAAGVDAPPLLWAVPEAPTGGRLRLNALCGITLGAHALTRAGRRYATLCAAPDDRAALAQTDALARAGRARRRLRGARIGRIGEHPEGFETCSAHPAALRERFGVELVQMALEDVFGGVRAADSRAVDALRATLRGHVEGLDEVEQGALRGTLATYLTLRDIAAGERLAGYAVRCWPQFFTDLGCAACGALGLLSDELTPASCETDVNGTVTQLILQEISGEPAFDCDVVSFDTEQDTAVLWHCGKAPLSMADPHCQPRATIHSNRRLPLLLEFALKPGVVTLARLSEATGEFRLVVGRGEVLPAPISFGGTSGVVRFERPARDVLSTILAEGLEHHLALTYGDHLEALLALAHLLDLPVLRL
jgi:L-fucose isomerase-like protein